MHTSFTPSELTRQVGQLFMVGIPGVHLDRDIEFLIRDFDPAGVILFSRNIEDPLQLAGLCSDLQDTAINYHQKPLFIAVDQEGGRVSRLREPFTIFPGNEAIGMDDNPPARAQEFASITAMEMKMVGLNMNLAPVVDVRRGEPERHLGGRMFGEDSETVSMLGGIVVRTLQENGVMAVAKHFPGLGRAGIDPHFHLPVIETDIKEIHRVNLPPFQAAIVEGVTALMTSHAVYPALDDKHPATLSPQIMIGLLRNQMRFNGLIVTDDLEMGAIAKKWGVAEGALMSFEAGADMLLICKDQGNLLESISLIREKILQGDIAADRLRQTLSRIQRAKSIFCKPGERISLEDVKQYFGQKGAGHA